MHVLDCLAATLHHAPTSPLPSTRFLRASDNLLAADCRDCGCPLRSQDHLICKVEQPPAMADLNVTNYRIDARQYTMPRIDLRDRRSGGQQPRIIRWVFQRHLEMVLYNRSDGGSTVRDAQLLNP